MSRFQDEQQTTLPLQQLQHQVKIVKNHTVALKQQKTPLFHRQDHVQALMPTKNSFPPRKSKQHR
ncbi:hypothetical protein KIN20_006255 [Parelaphostrongylus tenuis]|uniref:Uncharacterized protein n=1 Tax=Parelaphostrongylus tenuis TaxID=148309 RepID=A0AAD5M1G9_PARTN|nr:hypothetical protein KIN20_006255 [Parelaphostrongylus tenuis]